MGKFPCVASHNAAMFIIFTIFSRSQLIQNGNHKNSSFAHPRFSLAQNIMALKNVWDRIHLYFTWMLEPTLPDGPLELILEEKFIPACQVHSKLALSLTLLILWHLLFIRIVVRNIHNLLYLNYKMSNQQFEFCFSKILLSFSNSAHPNILSPFPLFPSFPFIIEFELKFQFKAHLICDPH